MAHLPGRGQSSTFCTRMFPLPLLLVRPFVSLFATNLVLISHTPRAPTRASGWDGFIWSWRPPLLPPQGPTSRSLCLSFPTLDDSSLLVDATSTGGQHNTDWQHSCALQVVVVIFCSFGPGPAVTDRAWCTRESAADFEPLLLGPRTFRLWWRLFLLSAALGPAQPQQTASSALGLVRS